ARRAVDTVLDAAPSTTGLLVHNERALPHVLAHLAERGRGVPGDVSVVVICPADVALAQRLPLTSIDIPGELIGGVVVDMVTARLEGGQPAETRLIAPELTPRASTAGREA